MTGIAFEIRVRGLVDRDSFPELAALEVTPATASTVLTGEAADQAALLGLLTRLRSDGMVITEVRRLSEDGTDCREDG